MFQVSFRHCTGLYPEWAFAKVAHTDGLLARDVAVALLTLPPLPQQMVKIKEKLRSCRQNEKSRDDMALIGFRLK